ncbi:hypothetical protein BH24ACT21_BH24ACT21_13100 [soil metagenome]
MKLSTYPLSGVDPRFFEKPVQQRALRAVERAREAVTLLEQTFRLMTEDDSIQPAIKYVYAALCEVETRAVVLEDWYGRTYSNGGLPERPRQPAY